MTPDEVFQQLRDIHTPQIATVTEWTALDPRPLMVFAMIAGLTLAVPRWRRWQRRMTLRRRIRGLVKVQPSDQRDALVHLAAQLPPTKRAPPKAFFRPSDQVTAEDAQDLRNWVLERVA